MKSSKSSGKSKRIRYRVSKDQRSKSPKLEPSDWKTTSDVAILSAEAKVKSGSWKRKTLRRNSPSGGDSAIKTKKSEQPSTPSSRFRPGILYSDVLFSGDNPSTLVKIRNLTPHQVRSHVQISKSHSKGRKRAFHCPTDLHKDKKNTGSDITLKKKDKKETAAIPSKSLDDLTECTEQLMKRLNIEIPSWNFSNFGTFNDVPKFVCQFDDYNYLSCEKVAFVGLRLASDGKFKF